MTTTPTQAQMQSACLKRDSAFDGIFFFAVKTTGIFCRPGCSARLALPKNVEFFATADQAIAAGYRACQRCHPLDINHRPDWAKQLLDELQHHPNNRISSNDLIARGLDPGTVRRYFRKHYSMTFQAYARSRRLGEALIKINHGASVDAARHDTGYESHSGFRDAFKKTFGQSPGNARPTDCLSVHWISSPLGPLIMGATSEGVCLLEFADDRTLASKLKQIQTIFHQPIIPRQTDVLIQLENQLRDYFLGQRSIFTVQLVLAGTSFQKRVWKQLLKIPYGTTQSYDEIARSISAPKAHRAVGTANGCNRIAIVIPCHRVINKNGKPGGYAGELWRKQFLLNLEKKHV